VTEEGQEAIQIGTYAISKGIRACTVHSGGANRFLSNPSVERANLDLSNDPADKFPTQAYPFRGARSNLMHSCHSYFSHLYSDISSDNKARRVLTPLLCEIHNFGNSA
jgi:hypothetical protein